MGRFKINIGGNPAFTLGFCLVHKDNKFYAKVCILAILADLYIVDGKIVSNFKR